MIERDGASASQPGEIEGSCALRGIESDGGCASDGKACVKATASAQAVQGGNWRGEESYRR